MQIVSSEDNLQEITKPVVVFWVEGVGVGGWIIKKKKKVCRLLQILLRVR